MNRNIVLFGVIAGFVLLMHHSTYAQQYSVGGRGGLSIFSSGGSSAGLQIGPTLDVKLPQGFIAGTDFNINTQNGTPIEWAFYAKYLVNTSRPDIIPYLDGGFGLWFMPGGPYFGLRVGGGAYFPLAGNISIPADIQLGPVFTTGSTTFYFAMTSGIRYTLP